MKIDRTYKVNVIVKVTNTKFLKYHVSNLLLFTAFLDNKFPQWKWFNVYNHVTRQRITSFTKYNRPTSAKI